MDEVETGKDTKQEFVNILHRQFQLLAEKGANEPFIGQMESCGCFGGSKRTFVVGQANSYYQFAIFPEFKKSQKLSIGLCSWLSNYRDFVDYNDPLSFRGSLFKKSKSEEL